METEYAMKVRIKFSKYGNMRFIGHLDVMRFFQKAFRRAGIDVAFTEGMSPHMILSFANPLGVGLSGYGEYADVELRTPISTKEALDRLNRASVEGIDFLDVRQVQEGKAGKAMSLVEAADYIVRFRDGYEPPKGWPGILMDFIRQDHIPFEKETKSGKKEVDLKPMILDAHTEEDGGVFLKLSAGSSANLRPELLINACAATAGFELPPFALSVSRMELYAAGENGGYISLNDLGTTIP